MLLGKDPELEEQGAPLPMHKPTVTFAYTKHMWVAGQRELAVTQLQNLIQACQYVPPGRSQITHSEEQKRLLARYEFLMFISTI